MAGHSVKIRRFGPQAGIAIGPILFIIAILAILAAAIAAGSGSFTSGTNSESDRTKSSALVQIGENLKIGMDNIVMSGGLTPTSVDINVNNTNLNNQLFSPSGGGIAPPSVGMANNPSIDKWYFPQGTVKGLGTGTYNDVIAVLPVSSSVCAEVNNRSTGVATTPTALALGDFITGTVAGGSTWPMPGVATGCVMDSDVTVGSNASPSSTYFFYQVLAIQ